MTTPKKPDALKQVVRGLRWRDVDLEAGTISVPLPSIKLTPEESRILRRQVAAVDSLFTKGLLAVVDRRVQLTTAGEAWITQDAERVRLVRINAGKVGGVARGEKLTRKQRVKIARLGTPAREARKKKGGTS